MYDFKTLSYHDESIYMYLSSADYDFRENADKA